MYCSLAILGSSPLLNSIALDKNLCVHPIGIGGNANQIVSKVTLNAISGDIHVRFNYVGKTAGIEAAVQAMIILTRLKQCHS